MTVTPFLRRPVDPGSGWPGDCASRSTPVATSASEVTRLAASAPTLAHLDGRVTVCRACPRLVDWREKVAAEKRAAFAEERYWGRPVSGFGPQRARIAVLGLAPAAHGGNRTGRVFTGDRSGDWLHAALHRAGLAAQPTSVTAGDGQELVSTRLLAAVRCAPPVNKPSTAERETCRPWLTRELMMISPTLRVIVALGGFAWTALWPTLEELGSRLPSPRPAFGHGGEVRLPPVDGSDDELLLLGCYHPSQQNTFTGRLTEDMLDDVFARAAAHARLPGRRTAPHQPERRAPCSGIRRP